MWEDITIFDPVTMWDTATYRDSIRFPEGIEHTIFNGELTVCDGEHTHRRSGSVLRNRQFIG